MSYIAVIRRNSDWLTREHVESREWTDGDEYGLGSDLSWWTEGSGGCDCNRANFFARAGGEPDPDHRCGDDAYTVIEFRLPDGRVIPCDDES